MTTRLATVVLGVAVAVSAAVPAQARTFAGAAEADGPTLAATFVVDGAHGGREVTVTAEPTTGRIQVDPYPWDTKSGGRYLHVGLGTTDGASCDLSRWVVVDTGDLDATTAYDAEGAALPVQHFDVGADWSAVLSRIAIPAFPTVDCLDVASHPGAVPIDSGSPILSSGPVPLAQVGFGGLDKFPATVDCPREVAAGDQLDIGVGYSTEPGTYAPAGLIPRPSGFGTITFTVDPSPDFIGTTSPEPPTDVDLWTDTPWAGDIVVDLAPSSVYFVKAHGTVDIDGAEAPWTCAGRIPVTVPVPTDWVGSLAGETWWTRGEGSNSGIGGYTLHRAYEFLDDEWVYVEDEYAEPRTEPCDTGITGCHRYYYDADTNRLQIDNRLARPRTGGWGMPSSEGRYATYLVDHTIRPVTTGQRIAYTGEGKYGPSLTLRRNGTYTCADCGGVKRDWAGRYRFIGGDAQDLVLHHAGADFRIGVALYYAEHARHTRLFDIDTEDRLFRVQRW